MDLEQVIGFINDNKEDDAVKSYLDGLRGEQEVNLDRIKLLADEDSGVKSWIDSVKDSHANKYLETWKTNNLDKIVDEKYRQELPKEEQENFAIKQLQDKIAEMEREKNYTEQEKLGIKLAHEKGLPSNLIKFFVGNNDEETLANFNQLEESFSPALEAMVKDRLKGGYAPPKSSTTKKLTLGDLNSDSTEDEINRVFEDNKRRNK